MFSYKNIYMFHYLALCTCVPFCHFYEKELIVILFPINSNKHVSKLR